MLRRLLDLGDEPEGSVGQRRDHQQARAGEVEQDLVGRQPALHPDVREREVQRQRLAAGEPETGGIPVYDINSRLSFPSRHPLNASMSKDAFRDADLVLCLDARDWEKPTTELVSTTRELTSVVPAAAKWI